MRTAADAGEVGTINNQPVNAAEVERMRKLQGVVLKAMAGTLTEVVGSGQNPGSVRPDDAAVEEEGDH